MKATKIKRVLKNLALVLCSSAFAIALAEGGMRMVDGYRLFSLQLEYSSVTGSGASSDAIGTGQSPTTETMGGLSPSKEFVSKFPAPPDVPKSWFDLQPPVASPKPVIIELEDYSEPFRNDPEMYKYVRRIWNVNCFRARMKNRKENRAFVRFPDYFYAFDTGNGDDRPCYRLFPNDPRPDGVQPNTGMVTNNLGFRGLDIVKKKPEHRVRIAFVGGSTTMHSQAFPGPSYPEYVGFWLNVWAQSRELSISFDVINAGREAFTSQDIRGVVENDLANLDVDMVVYYEGANQFWRDFRRLLDMGPTSAFYEPLKLSFENEELVLRAEGPFAYSALFRRIALFQIPSTDRLVEIPKPPYTLTFPAGIDEFDPSPSNPNLPMKLPQIYSDLEKMRLINSERDIDFVISSFIWLAYEGLTLDPGSERGIHWYLNGHPIVWPLRYKDVRRIIDFENRFFENYAKHQNLFFIDLAKMFPQQSEFFVDAIHNNTKGIKLRGWLAFLALLPRIQQNLDMGLWPKEPKTKIGDPTPTFFQAELCKFMVDGCSH